jgi:hypothetical protein
VRIPARDLIGGELAGDLVDVIRGIGSDGDLLRGLDELAMRAARVQGVRVAAILVIDELGVPQVVGLSDHALVPTSLISRLRTAPTVSSACSSNEPFVDLAPTEGRWSMRMLGDLDSLGTIGVAVLPPATPTPLGAAVLAVLDADPLERGMLSLAVFADLVAVVIRQAEPQPDDVTRLRTFRRALDGRNTVEQAKGMLAERFGIPPEIAWRRLRDRAEALGASIVEMATDVVDRAETFRSDWPDVDPSA